MSNVKQFFEADDGSKHPTAELAKRHNELRDAERQFEQAGKRLKQCMLQAATTADGEPFDLKHWGEYWAITPAWEGLPRLFRVRLWPYECEVGVDPGNAGRIAARHYDNEERRYRSYPVCELYKKESAARQAHIEACDRKLAEMREEVAQLKGIGR